MTQLKFTVSAAATIALGTAPLWMSACSMETEYPDPTGGTGGNGVSGTSTSGSSGSSGKGTAGTAPGTGGSGGSAGSVAAGTGGAGGTTAGTGPKAGAGGAGASPGGASGAGGTASGAGGAGASAGGAGGTAGGVGGATGGVAGSGPGGSGSGTAGSGAGTSGGGAGGGSAGTTGGGEDDINSGDNTMGWIGCSMANNVAEGYARIGGTRMWGGYGNGGAVVQNWTDPNSGNWNTFDTKVADYGPPVAVWMMVCVFSSGATMQEIRQMVANTKEHAPGAYLYISGQPLYEEGHVCNLAGDGMPETTDMQAEMIAAEDPDVHYVGPLGPLNAGEYGGDSCHTTSSGGDKIGRQVKAIWGQP